MHDFKSLNRMNIKIPIKSNPVIKKVFSGGSMEILSIPLYKKNAATHNSYTKYLKSVRFLMRLLAKNTEQIQKNITYTRDIFQKIYKNA